MFNQIKIKKIIKILILIIIAILVFCFVMKNFFPAEWSFITPHKQGDFVRVGNMHLNRHVNKPILLDDGKVLFSGNRQSEYYNPKTRKFYLINNNGLWIPDGSVSVKLLNGQVLFIGGENKLPCSVSSDVILFNPKTKKYKKVGDMRIGRVEHSVILLKNGDVLIIGGKFLDPKKYKNNKKPATHLHFTESYDYKTNNFKTGPNLPKALNNPQVFIKEDGNVLILGGLNDKYEPNMDVYLFDYKANVISKIGELSIKRSKQDMFLLNSGKILILQGIDYESDSVSKDIEIFNPETQKTVVIGKLSSGRRNSPIPIKLTAALLPNDNILLYGGGFAASFVYQPYFEADIYSAVNNKQIVLSNKTKHLYEKSNAILLKDGNLLMMSGGKAQQLAEVYILDKK